MAQAPNDLGRSMVRARKGLYRRYLEHCLEDHCLSVEEPEDLAHLRSIRHVEDAVNAGLEDACRAVPDISSLVVSEIGADIANGRVKRWQVKFKAGLGADS